MRGIFPPFPIKEEALLLWASEQIYSGLKVATIRSYFSHLKDFHRNWFWPQWDHLAFPTLPFIVEGWSKSVAVETIEQRQPWALSFFRIWLQFLGDDFHSHCVFTAFLVQWWAFARGGEIFARSTWKSDRLRDRTIAQVRVFADHMIIFLPVSKGDPFSRGAHLLVPRIPDEDICPFTWMVKLHNRRTAMGGKIHPSKSRFLFPDPNGRPLSVEMARRELWSVCNLINIPPEKYNLHSFRIGAATEFFRRGFSTEIIKNLGRWRGDTCEIYNRPTAAICADISASLLEKPVRDDRKDFVLEFGDEFYHRR